MPSLTCPSVKRRETGLTRSYAVARKRLYAFLPARPTNDSSNSDRPIPHTTKRPISRPIPLFMQTCGKPGDFLHILLTCPTFPHPPSPAVAVSYWESTMNSTSASDQRKIISCAMKRIALQGLSCVL
ncbi:hypothetical protein HPB50_027490 [Hyalomma asiaticum]|uniref:Uncharacterized protein n=1 Tax=Hyalomma asiaticum TaxID=266040 RepID=A0ACB7TEI9_HYAAI|nr:hypothetical protein HPB50_027490 [Hyalomma asiaticum]